MQFGTVEVIKTEENTFFIEWDMVIDDPMSESIDDYKFQIQWSKDPASGFCVITDTNNDPIEIDGAIGPLTYNHAIKQYDFNQDHYYQIIAIEKAVPTNEILSSIVFIGMYKDGVHETLKYAENVLYSHYHGEPCFVIKRKSFGARCPSCWSPSRQQRMKTHCDVCNGTGFVTGYYQPIPLQISFDSDPKKTDSQKEWENVYDTKRARMSNYPLVRPKDLVVNTDNNKRYVISHVDTTKLPLLSKSKTELSKQNYIVSQLLVLEELNPDDNEYFIDIENIPPAPCDPCLPEFPTVSHTHVESHITDLNHRDSHAIHDDEPAEISPITEKLNPAADDIFIIEDSESSFDKKKVKLKNIVDPAESLVSVSIDPGEDKSVDNILLADSHFEKWLIYVQEGTNTRALELLAKEDALLVQWTIYGILGVPINFDINVVSDATNMTLRIKNNETNQINVTYRRLVT